MAVKKISEMETATELTDAYIPIIQNNVNKKAAASLFTGGCLKYVALISQSGSSNPVVTVLENTLGGTVTWSRISEGVYFGETSSLFTENKTLLFHNSGVILGNQIIFFRNTSSRVSISTYQNGIVSDDSLDNLSIEIRVYP